MVYNSNPMVVCPEQEKIAAGLARDDLFTVVSDHFVTDTARLRGHRAAGDDPARAARHHVQLGALLRHAEHPGGRRRSARRSPTPSCSAGSPPAWASPSRASPGPTRRWSPRPSTGRPRRWTGSRVDSLLETGWARLNLPSADEYAPHAEGGFPTPSGKTEFRRRGRCGGQLRRPAVPPGLQRVPARRSGRPAAALHPAAGDGATPGTGSA